MSSSALIGAVYRLFGPTCKKCHYCTKTNQCAWWEYPHIRRAILEEKRKGIVGKRVCPYYRDKTTVNAPFAFVSYKESPDGVIAFRGISEPENNPEPLEKILEENGLVEVVKSVEDGMPL